MSRMIKWFIPAVAFALLLGFSGEQSRAQQEEKKKTGTVSGTVTKEDGTGAANVRVRVVAPPSKPKEGGQPAAAPTAADEKPKDKGERKPRERMKAVAEGTTDAEGKFSIENVPAGKFMVVAGGKGHGMARQLIEVKEGETVTVTLQLKAPKRDKQ